MVVTVVPTAGNWLSFKDVERETGIPSTSLRRFAERFPVFLAGRRIDRALCFPPDALATFRRIHELYRDGKQTPEVAAILAGEQMPTLDVSPITTDATTIPTPAPAPDLAPAIQAFAAAVDRLAAGLERQNELQARTLAVMESRLAVLESMATRPPQEAPEPTKRPDTHADTETGLDRADIAPSPPPGWTRADTLALVHELRSAGMGSRAVATEMRRRGIPTLSGRGAWAAGAVKRIVKGEIKE